jgi:predicted nucleic-acid-binding Zn-ribbon protein
MKNSKKCPKCQYADIVRIPSVNPRHQGSTIPLSWGGLRLIKLTRYLCASCGYMEEWIDAPEDIATLKDNYGAAPG